MEERPKNTPIVKKYFIYHRLNAGVSITLWPWMGGQGMQGTFQWSDIIN